MKRLLPKQRAFVEHYAACGNATEAARLAGYSERYANRFARQLLDKPHVREALTELVDKVSGERVADAKERLEFWTAVMRNPAELTRDRLKASELLARAQGDFMVEAPVTTINNLWITPDTLRTIREVVYGLSES
ncbi:MAG TPA: terminase small subunit [Candidatus Competibacteraceae bacterium]|nr:terminase small subunit [Candidatus Competibacteraceae bacterium]